MRKRKGKKGGVTISMEGVEAGGKIIPDGKYLAEVESGEVKEGEESGKPYIEWKYKIVKGKQKGGVVFDNTSLQPQALFRLRGLLECVGFEFPEEGKFKFDPSDIVGEQLTIDVVNDEFEGRERPKVASYGAADAADEDEDEDEEESEEEDEDEDDEDDKKKKKGKKGKKSKDEDEDEEEEEEDEDEDEEEEEEEEKPKKKKKGKKDEDEDEEEEEDEDEDEKPKKGKWKKGDKVKFHDEETDKNYKGKITDLDEDGTATVDVKGDEWQVDVSELKSA